MMAPISRHWKTPMTSLLEWMIVEKPQMPNVIPGKFGKKVALRLMFEVIIRSARHWRGIKAILLKQRRIHAVIKQLDKPCEAKNGLDSPPSQVHTPSKIPNTSWI